MPPDEVTLREFMEERMRALEVLFARELSNLSSAVEKLAGDMVTGLQFEQLARDVTELKEQGEEQQGRIVGLEGFQRVVRYVGGIAVAVFVASQVGFEGFEADPEMMAMVAAVVNIVLRLVTKQGVSILPIKDEGPF